MKFQWKDDNNIGLYILQYCDKDGKFNDLANLYDSHYYHVPFTRYTYSCDNEICHCRHEPLKSRSLKDAKNELIGIFIKMYSDEMKRLNERIVRFDDTVSGLNYFIKVDD